MSLAISNRYLSVSPWIWFSARPGKRALQRAEDKPGHFCGRFRKPEFAARGAAPEDRPEPLLMRLEKSRDPLMMN